MTSISRPQQAQGRRRERSGVSRMIRAWPADMRFEDADVPPEGIFKGSSRDIAGIWPEYGRNPVLARSVPSCGDDSGVVEG